MSNFKFEGDWETKIKLTELSKIIHPDFLSFKDKSKVKEEIKMTIEDVKNLNPDPEKQQLKTIEFLQNENNQNEIIESIFNYINEVAYPYFQSWFSNKEQTDNYPTLKSSKDLYKAIGFSEVNIHNFFKDEFSIYTLSFYSIFANEGQLNLTFHKTRILDHIEWSVFPSEKLMEELEFRNLTEDEYEKLMEEQKKKEPVFHLPNQKYGKLKPWQKSANKSYPYNLLKKGKYEKLKSFIESHGEDFENLNSNLLKTISNFKIQIPKEFEDFFKSLN